MCKAPEYKQGMSNFISWKFSPQVNVMSEDSDKSLEIHHVEAAFVESLM